MRCSFALAALSALLASSAAVVVQPSNVGPLSPEQNPSTSLTESIRRMKLSLDRELVYLAHMEDISESTDTAGLVARQQSDDYHGFRTTINDGKSTFRPILPGTQVPSARMVADEPMETPMEFDDEFPATVTAPPDTMLPVDTPIPVPADPSTSFAPMLPTAVPFPTDPQAPIESLPPMEPGVPTTTEPGVPTITEPGVPTITEPGVPTITEPGVPTIPGPGVPTITEPGVPTITEPGVPTITEPGVPTISEPPRELPIAAPSPMPSLAPESPPLLPVGGTPAPSASPIDANTSGFIGEGSLDTEESDTEEPSPTEEDSVCFPADATVQLEDGSVKTMADVQLGDRVLVEHGQFSPVFMFTHKLAQARYNFVNIQTSSGNTLALTAGHYLYVNGHLSAASTVKNGDTLMLADSSLTHVTHVSTVTSTGLFNPQTLHGDIVVNGLKASTYTTAIEPSLAHALLSPLRAAYSRLGFSLSAFEAGADRIASYMPSGALVN